MSHHKQFAKTHTGFAIIENKIIGVATLYLLRYVCTTKNLETSNGF
ncbi:MAG TPA: hypothetical protein VJ499_11425 [Flavisolibacter sp.]|nr:hypothetical protein [Flavisolibacter sp.]